MTRNRVALSVSLTPELAQVFDRLARKEKKTRSALLREMIVLYERKETEEDFYRLQRQGASIARDAGAFTEEDVERIVFEGR